MYGMRQIPYITTELDEASFDAHTTTIHGTICMKTFKSTHFLKHHMDKHNTSYEYACPVCDKKFKFKNNMRGHLRKHNMEKKFECEVCHKKFIGRYVMFIDYLRGDFIYFDGLDYLLYNPSKSHIIEFKIAYKCLHEAKVYFTPTIVSYSLNLYNDQS